MLAPRASGFVHRLRMILQEVPDMEHQRHVLGVSSGGRSIGAEYGDQTFVHSVACIRYLLECICNFCDGTLVVSRVAPGFRFGLHYRVTHDI